MTTDHEHGSNYMPFADYVPTGTSRQLERIPLNIGGTPYKPVTFSKEKLTSTVGGYTVTIQPSDSKFLTSNQLQTARLQVWGNCRMCKTTIEKAARSVVGVESAEWNMEKGQFTVVFNPAKTAVAKVHQVVAAAGYDTEAVRGDNVAYNNLHGCCQYERRP